MKKWWKKYFTDSSIWHWLLWRRKWFQFLNFSVHERPSGSKWGSKTRVPLCLEKKERKEKGQSTDHSSTVSSLSCSWRNIKPTWPAALRSPHTFHLFVWPNCWPSLLALRLPALHPCPQLPGLQAGTMGTVDVALRCKTVSEGHGVHKSDREPLKRSSEKYVADSFNVISFIYLKRFVQFDQW